MPYNSRMSLKLSITLISSFFVISSLFYYIYFIVKRKALPHALSWLIWGATTLVVYFAQLTENTGIGSLTTLVAGLTYFLIGGVAYCYTKKGTFTKGDWLSVSLAIIAVLLWIITSEPLYAVILITLADNIGYYPTFRKAYYKPFEEMPLIYFIGFWKFSLPLIIFHEVTLTNALFPICITFMECALFIFLLVRRWQLKSSFSTPHP